MSSVNLNASASSVEQLRTINLMAESAGGTAAGRIGMLNGRVIKFNTHVGERLFGAKATPAMLKSSDDLRTTLCNLLDGVLKGKVPDADIDALKAQINAGAGKKLLDRSVVANVIKDVGKKVGQEFGHSKAELSKYASADDASFAKVASAINLSSIQSGVVAQLKGAKTLKERCEVVANYYKTEFKKDGVAGEQSASLKRATDFVIEKDDELQYALDVDDLANALDDDGDVGQTADIVVGLQKRHPDEKQFVQIYADRTAFGGYLFTTSTNPTQEEGILHSVNPEPVIAVGRNHTKVGKGLNGSTQAFYQAKGKDGSEGLDTQTSWMLETEFICDGKMKLLDKPIPVNLHFTSMPSLTLASHSFDPVATAKYMFRNRGLDPNKDQDKFEKMLAFVKEFQSRKGDFDEIFGWAVKGEGDDKNWDSRDSQDRATIDRTVMQLLTFGGDDDRFDVLGSGGNLKAEVDRFVAAAQKEVRLVLEGKESKALATAKKNYEQTLMHLMSGWMSSARQAGADRFVGGGAGLGVFNNDRETTLKILARAYVMHAKDPATGKVMKFTYAAFSSDKDRKFFQEQVRAITAEVAAKKNAATDSQPAKVEGGVSAAAPKAEKLVKQNPVEPKAEKLVRLNSASSDVEKTVRLNSVSSNVEKGDMLAAAFNKVVERAKVSYQEWANPIGNGSFLDLDYKEMIEQLKNGKYGDGLSVRKLSEANAVTVLDQTCKLCTQYQIEGLFERVLDLVEVSPGNVGDVLHELRENAGSQERFVTMLSHGITDPNSLLVASRLGDDIKSDRFAYQDTGSFVDDFGNFAIKKVAPALREQIRRLTENGIIDDRGCNVFQTLKALNLILLEDKYSYFTGAVEHARPEEIAEALEKFKQQRTEGERSFFREYISSGEDFNVTAFSEEVFKVQAQAMLLETIKSLKSRQE